MDRDAYCTGGTSCKHWLPRNFSRVLATRVIPSKDLLVKGKGKGAGRGKDGGRGGGGRGETSGGAEAPPPKEKKKLKKKQKTADTGDD